MRIEQRSVYHLALDRSKRVTDIGGGTDHCEARLLKDARDIEGDEELIFDNEDACGRHIHYAPTSRRSPGEFI
jgi:hypothetical protein